MKVDLIHNVGYNNMVRDVLSERKEFQAMSTIQILVANVCRGNKFVMEDKCRAPLHKGCPKHHGHKGDPGVTPGTCGASGNKAQVILVWMRAPRVGNASHPQRLRVMRVRS
jgi:hypothetical protein